MFESIVLSSKSENVGKHTRDFDTIAAFFALQKSTVFDQAMSDYGRGCHMKLINFALMIPWNSSARAIEPITL